ncbi:MAG: hypothetical protein K2N63_04660 [Lachnospiraceae bacterium]|nr:hypothetical protein [Lachnospiraceae bacterium]
MPKKKTPASQGGEYVTLNGQTYFQIGKTRIKVTEHFLEAGPSMADRLLDVITYTARSGDLDKIA